MLIRVQIECPAEGLLELELLLLLWALEPPLAE